MTTRLLTATSVQYRAMPLLPETAEAFQSPCIIAANHRSLFDVFAAYRIMGDLGVQVRPISAAWLWEKPGLRSFLDAVGAIPLGAGRDGFVTIDRAQEAVAQGFSLLLTPEGRLVPPEERTHGVGPGHKILSKVASAAGVPVVAAAMTGTDQFWPAHRPFPKPTLGKRVEIHYGFAPPRVLSGPHRENVDLVMADIGDLLQAAEPVIA